jgi:hypothetical protein
MRLFGSGVPVQGPAGSRLIAAWVPGVAALQISYQHPHERSPAEEVAGHEYGGEHEQYAAAAGVVGHIMFIDARGKDD